MRRSTIIGCLVAGLLLVSPGGARAAAGSLDPSFSGDGLEILSPDTVSDAFDVAIQSDDSIVLAGGAGPRFSPTRWVVVRLKPGGSYDPAFGTGGKAVKSFGDGNDQAFAVQLVAGGKVLVAGHAGAS